MPTSRRTLLKTSAAAAASFTFDWRRAQAQAETVRIGLIYDLTGPFAAGGSVPGSFRSQWQPATLPVIAPRIPSANQRERDIPTF